MIKKIEDSYNEIINNNFTPGAIVLLIVGFILFLLLWFFIGYSIYWVFVFLFLSTKPKNNYKYLNNPKYVKTNNVKEQTGGFKKFYDFVENIATNDKSYITSYKEKLNNIKINNDEENDSNESNSNSSNESNSNSSNENNSNESNSNESNSNESNSNESSSNESNSNNSKYTNNTN